MDILYIVGDKSECDNFELRCSLRSIAKYGVNVGKVCVVGNCPDWLSDEVIKIPCEDYHKNPETQTHKAQNIAKKLIYAVGKNVLDDEFLVSMDDHFYVAPTDFSKYPFYVKDINNNGLLPSVGHADYSKFLSECKDVLEAEGLPTYYFTLHRNMHVIRQALETRMDQIMEHIILDQPMEIFTYLNNYAYKRGWCTPTLIKDNRINSPSEWWRTSPEYDHVFSTCDFKKGLGFYTLLKGLFPNQCKYEAYDEIQYQSTAPKVSVIIPVYNTSKYLRRCLDSVISQTLSDIEIICVNDGSTDDSLSILNEYAKKDNRIKVITTKNRGVGPARNTGIFAASGDYIGFVDSDDYIDKSFYNTAYSCIDGYDVVCLPIARGEKNTISKKRLYGAEVVACLFKKEFLLKNNILFENVEHEDTVFRWLYQTYNPSVYKVPDNGVYYHYMMREGSLCNYSKEHLLKFNK